MCARNTKKNVGEIWCWVLTRKTFERKKERWLWGKKRRDHCSLDVRRWLAMSHKLEKVIICWLVSGVTIDYCLISFQNTFLNVRKKHKEKCWWNLMLSFNIKDIWEKRKRQTEWKGGGKRRDRCSLANSISLLFEFWIILNRKSSRNNCREVIDAK